MFLNSFVIFCWLLVLVSADQPYGNDPYGAASSYYSPPFELSYGSGLSEFVNMYNDTNYYTNGSGASQQEILHNIQQVYTIQTCDKAMTEEFINNQAAYSSLPGSPTRVTLQLVILNIDGLSDRSQEATMSLFIDFTWTDLRIKNAFEGAGNTLGNPQACGVDTTRKGGIRTYVTENMRHFWCPIFTVDNSADRLLYFEAWEKFPGVFYPNGTIFWRSSFRFQLNCDMTFSVFPFDGQDCRVLIRSPNYNLFDLEYIIDSERAIVFWDRDSNSDALWDVTGHSSGMTTGVPGVNVWLRYERKYSFYTWTLVLPTLAVSVMTMLTFILPPESGEKMTTVTTGVLAYFLLLLALTSLTPEVSESMPALAIFFVCTIAVGIVGAIATAILLRVASSMIGRSKSIRAAMRRPVLCGLSLNTLNSLCFLGYLFATAACYAIYMLYVYDTLKNQRMKINYTSIQYY